MYRQFCLFCLILILCISCKAQINISELKGPYLGQKPPGMKPEIFAPGIISGNENDGCVSFTADGQYFFFERFRSSENGIFIMERQKDRWSKPLLAPFSDGQNDGDFTLAPDNRTVYFASGRPLKEGGEPLEDHNIWKSEMTSTGWTKPVPLEYPVNTKYHDSYPCEAENRTLYFFSRRPGGYGKGDLYRCKFVNGKYGEAENLGSLFNTEHMEGDPYIAPGESYIIYCSYKPGGYGEADMYISFKDADGKWLKPVNMGERINTPYEEWMPYVTPDGKYFFFTTNIAGHRDIYWVDAEVLNSLKPEQNVRR